MTTERKVRANFDLTKEYSVDVSKCTHDEKKQVQQAFYDVGVHWESHLSGVKYRHLDALQYTNTNSGGIPTRGLLTTYNTEGCNMTPAEFLELVYEPEQQGHVHAALMAQYAEDAKTTDKPWELWQIHVAGDVWHELSCNPTWGNVHEYRRKPKTHIVHGVEVPDLRIEPQVGEEYYVPNPLVTQLHLSTEYTFHKAHSHRHNSGLCYAHTEEGKQAAILHAKAMLGVAV